MKYWFRHWQMAGACAFLLAAPAAPAAPPQLKLERVVMLMRHGVRPPTKAQPIPARYSPEAWPRWKVGPGLLTHHGAKGIALLGSADRAYFIAAGLLPASGCPATGQVKVQASRVPRAIDTAKSWSKAVLPGCDIKVQHPAPGTPDSMFHALEAEPKWFDGRRAYHAALALTPPGGLAVQAKELAPLLQQLEAVLGCVAPACDLEQDTPKLIERAHNRPQFHGSLDVASTASQSLLLEYVEGRPMTEVGWGRVTRDQIERLLVFNTIKFDYADRPLFIAQAAAGPLARAMLDALRTPGGAPITLFAGHDTNIAELGGLLGLHWQAASYPVDAVPPGSALSFELLSDGSGRQYVRAFFRAQTMDQLRNLDTLGPANPPYRAYIRLPGCGAVNDPLSCDLAAFIGSVEARLQ